MGSFPGIPFRRLTELSKSFNIIAVIEEKAVRNKKSKIYLLPNMIELFETNKMSYFPHFYDDFFL